MKGLHAKEALGAEEVSASMSLLGQQSRKASPLPDHRFSLLLAFMILGLQIQEGHFTLQTLVVLPRPPAPVAIPQAQS